MVYIKLGGFKSTIAYSKVASNLVNLKYILQTGSIRNIMYLWNHLTRQIFKTETTLEKTGVSTVDLTPPNVHT